jgi:hypothetical protein
MDSEGQLASAIALIRSHLPCSVELPAGAGKTHLIAALTASLASSGKRTLILTHTHAGVDALRRRALAFGTNPRSMAIRTIDGWCFDLIRHFPELSRLSVPEEPEWADSKKYHEAAVVAIHTAAVRRMLIVSYDLVVVDEYQDCLVDQHFVILALKEILPAVVFGDRLQGLFNFGANVPVAWDTDVVAHFAPQLLVPSPHRWDRTNAPLGRWLQSIREPLIDGQAITLTDAPVTWQQASDGRAQARSCLAQTKVDGSVVALGQFRWDCTKVAQRLNGSYGVMEELEAKELLKLADLIDTREAPKIASGAVQFAVNCATGVADKFASSARRRLADGNAVAMPSKPELRIQCETINGLLTDPSPQNVRTALLSLEQLAGFRPYCREAWREVLTALQHAALEPDLTVRAAVTRQRNHTRIVGRRAERRVVSRPLLVKGLEYDHVILLDADRYTAAELYVALTRGSHSVTVISKSQIIKPVSKVA